MAGLIKAIDIGLEPIVLGQPVAPPVAADKEPQKAATIVHTELDTKPPAASPTGMSQSVSPVEVEESVYQRLMAEHGARLQEIEEEARKAAYATGYAEGKEAGYAAGLEEGKQSGEQGYADALQALLELTKAGQKAMRSSLDDTAPVIAEIVFMAVSKIVGATLATQAGVQEVVTTAIEDAKRQEIVAVKISRSDMALLQVHAADLQPGLSALKELGLEVDDSIELGGCIVQLKGGHIDARIETQFRIFAQSLKEAVRAQR
jgi:flagellar assembly protein FliH